MSSDNSKFDSSKKNFQQIYRLYACRVRVYIYFQKVLNAAWPTHLVKSEPQGWIGTTFVSRARAKLDWLYWDNNSNDLELQSQVPIHSEYLFHLFDVCLFDRNN